MSTEGNTSATARIAASVIAETPDTAPEATVESSDYMNAFAIDHPEAVAQEVEALMGDADPDDRTRRIAAVNWAKANPNRLVETAEGMVRRAHDPNGNPTSIAARQMADLHAWGEGLPTNPKDSEHLAIHKFAESLGIRGPQHPAGSKAWHQRAEDIMSELIAIGRANR